METGAAPFLKLNRGQAHQELISIIDKQEITIRKSRSLTVIKLLAGE
jgi:hypothetical protein